MAAGKNETLFCTRCRTTFKAVNFFQTYNTEKYPTGRLNVCKKCITAHVQPFETDTFLWILEECDVPYIPDRWNSVILKYRDNLSTSIPSVVGSYLSSMRLKKYKDYRWKDTEILRELDMRAKEQAMREQGMAPADIALELEREKASHNPAHLLEQGNMIPSNQVRYFSEGGNQPVPIPTLEPIGYKSLDLDSIGYEEAATSSSPSSLSFGNAAPSAPTPVSFFNPNAEEIDWGLTEEDIKYLRIKWGRTYKEEEWVRLEQLYEDMMSSYDIQGAGHLDNLKLLCKTSLKANQLIDIGDEHYVSRNPLNCWKPLRAS